MPIKRWHTRRLYYVDTRAINSLDEGDEIVIRATVNMEKVIEILHKRSLRLSVDYTDYENDHGHFYVYRLTKD